MHFVLQQLHAKTNPDMRLKQQLKYYYLVNKIQQLFWHLQEHW